MLRVEHDRGSLLHGGRGATSADQQSAQSLFPSHGPTQLTLPARTRRQATLSSPRASRKFARRRCLAGSVPDPVAMTGCVPEAAMDCVNSARTAWLRLGEKRKAAALSLAVATRRGLWDPVTVIPRSSGDSSSVMGQLAAVLPSGNELDTPSRLVACREGVCATPLKRLVMRVD